VVVVLQHPGRQQGDGGRVAARRQQRVAVAVSQCAGSSGGIPRHKTPAGPSLVCVCVLLLCCRPLECVLVLRGDTAKTQTRVQTGERTYAPVCAGQLSVTSEHTDPSFAPTQLDAVSGRGRVASEGDCMNPCSCSTRP
jgi:hypothetical protein